MMLVKFSQCKLESYKALDVYDPGTLYFCVDVPSLYLGRTKITSSEDLNALLTQLNIAEGDIQLIKAALDGFLSGDSSIEEAIKSIETKFDKSIEELRIEISKLMNGDALTAEEIRVILGGD